MEERRQHERIFAALEVKVTWPGRETLLGFTVDLSDGGVLIHVDFNPQPPRGTVMELQLNRLINGDDPPLLRARVIRAEAGLIAFQFLIEP